MRFSVEHMEISQLRDLQSQRLVNLVKNLDQNSMFYQDKFKTLAQLCSTNVIVPADVKCCGFAGDRGFNFPELNKSALRSLKEQTAGAKMAFSTSKTCEIGLSEESGLDYNSIFYLINKVTKAKTL